MARLGNCDGVFERVREVGMEGSGCSGMGEVTGGAGASGTVVLLLES